MEPSKTDAHEAWQNRFSEEKQLFEKTAFEQFRLPANQREDAFQKALSDLNARHAQLLEMRYASAGAPVKYTVIGAKFGFTRDRARMIRTAAMRQLQIFYMGRCKAGSSDISVLDMGFPVQTLNRLLRAGVYTLGQLCMHPFKKLCLLGIGKTGASEIAGKLMERGFQLNEEGTWAA